MKTNLVMLVKKLTFVSAIVVGLTAAGVRSASATTFVTCTPTVVEYSDAPGFQLVLVTCSGTNYAAQTSPGGGCAPANSRSLDVQKFFMTLAESAVLAGKNLRIGFNVCASSNFIESMDLIK
jgi:hypothetical protein